MQVGRSPSHCEGKNGRQGCGLGVYLVLPALTGLASNSDDRLALGLAGGAAAAAWAGVDRRSVYGCLRAVLLLWLKRRKHYGACCVWGSGSGCLTSRCGGARWREGWSEPGTCTVEAVRGRISISKHNTGESASRLVLSREH